jgi:hypothetical protein
MENLGLDNWKKNFEPYLTIAQNYFVYLIAGFAAIIILAGGLYWYYYNSVQKEQAATTILADCLSQYEQAVQGKAQWADVVTMAHAGYNKFSNTKVAPYILSVEIDGLLAQDKKQEALDRLNFMVSKMSSSSPLYDLYALKQALIKLDMSDLKESALQDLQKLAAAQHNNFADAAQYYLGLYYQSTNSTDKALETWKKLAALNDTVTDALARSPWATMAQAKISGLA